MAYEDHGKGYQVPGVMWSQLWRLLLMGNGAENTLLVSLDCAARAWGCCFLLKCDSPGASPVQVWLHTGTMQVPQVPLSASRTVRFYCLEAKKCLNKSWHKIWATFQNKGMKILPSWRAEFQLCATTCVLTLQLWLPHCFSRSSFHWQLSPLSSLLTPASHASFSSIGPFHFPHLLFPMFFLPILLLWCFTKILCQLERSLYISWAQDSSCLLPADKAGRPRQDQEWQSKSTSKTLRASTYGSVNIPLGTGTREHW